MLSFGQSPGQRSAAALPPRRTGFVELGRRFASFTKNSDSEDAADESYLLRALTGQGRFDWKKLREYPLVVVLGEQGSGKSWEVENQAAVIAAAGEYSFFVRLEELIDQTLPAALGDGARVFARWKSGTEPATFFLDSVDESKLKGAEDFHTALKHFREALPVDLAGRVRIVLSSRVSEWHPETDGPRVREFFGLPSRKQKSEPVDDDDDETSTTKSGQTDFLVVQITPLVREQVKALVQAKGYDRVDEFLTALDRAHAWEFARRPIDVIALVDFWRQKGRIGSLTELIDFDLERNLRERRAHANDPLSETDARAGAEALAAGVVFCGMAGIKVTDENLTGPGLDGRRCVPANLTRDQFDALLTRAVFDGANHGRVRFHHRRIREYLAAAWVTKRMLAGCSMAELDSLFFDQISGQRVLRASRGPVAAWLCGGQEPFNAAMRTWVLEASPGLNLKYGDPAALSLAYKRAILAKLVADARQRAHLWLETDEDTLSRLADPQLVPDIEAIIRDQSLAGDLRTTMVEVVRYGRLTACLPTVLEAMGQPQAPREMKTYAVAAIREINDPASLDRLMAMAPTFPQVSPGLADMLVDALYPSRLSLDDFIALIRKTRERNGRPPNLDYHIKAPLEERLTAEQAGPLLHRLVELLRTEPHFLRERGEAPVSQEFAWLRPLVAVTLTALLKQRALASGEIADASEALGFLGSMRTHRELTGEETPKLQQLTLAHPAVRRGFFWASIARRRPIGPHAIDHPLDIFSRFEQMLEPAYADVLWLVPDLKTLPSEADREVALRHAMQWCNDSGRPWRLRWRIGRAVGANPRLREILREMDRTGRIRPLQRYYYRLQNAYSHRRRQGERAYGWLRSRFARARDHWFLWRNSDRVARGTWFGVTCHLVHDADPKNRDRWTVSRWTALEHKWGRRVVEATRTACKGFWRTYRPELPHEAKEPSSIPNQIIVGLTGLQAAWADGELNFDTLSEEEVKVATRYAMREMNGMPPWLAPLAERRPDAANAVFDECVTAEWNQPDDRPHKHEGLQQLARRGTVISAALQASILSRLLASDPAGRALGCIVTMLLNSAAPPLAEFPVIAQARATDQATQAGPLAMWFVLWLQLDPAAAMDAWIAHMQKRTDADHVMLLICWSLQDRDFSHGPTVPGAKHRTVPAIRRLLPLVYAHVRPADDIDRSEGGGYSPGARDYAQDFRSGLLRELTDSADSAAAGALLELAELPLFSNLRDRLLHLRDEHLKQQADRQRWRPADVRQFAEEHEVDPQTDRDLFRIVLKRFSDVKNDLEKSDLGLRTQLRPADLEARLRIWVAQELLRRARQRYTVPQEAVIDQNERPDIRLEHPRTDPVSAELKWAQRWSLNELVEALENQLLGQYLRAHNSRHGVLVLGMIGDEPRHWLVPDGSRLDFAGLINYLQAKAAELEKNHAEVKRLTVIGLDFRAPQKH